MVPCHDKVGWYFVNGFASFSLHVVANRPKPFIQCIQIMPFASSEDDFTALYPAKMRETLI